MPHIEHHQTEDKHLASLCVYVCVSVSATQLARGPRGLAMACATTTTTFAGASGTAETVACQGPWLICANERNDNVASVDSMH